MTDGSLNLFADALNDLANGPHGTNFQTLTEGLLRRLAEKGLTLAQCADRRMLNRSVSTLESHCRAFGIRFPDYTPSNMRKHVTFVQRGDFVYLQGPEVKAIAAILNSTFTERDDEDELGIPLRSFEIVKADLKGAGYAAKAKLTKKKREASHA